MLLSAGQKLAHYEILELVGQGGMGEVYRARDTKLGRDVAINVLPEAFAQDQERLSRFKREAKLLVSLNHSNIATLHGLEQSGPHHYLVMEFVEGETLADRIAKGPVPIDEALALFGQIAEGLEAAHDDGVIHRDLKPDNIMITPDGKPKILDFGLAKARDEPPGSNRSESPTVTKGTLAGVILGTASYMSPEQASGRSVDTRTDIWSFGVVLWEALLGRPLFTGETVSHVLAAVLRDEIDWSALPGGTPRAVRRLLRRCLEREPKGRLQHIGDARIEIHEASNEPASDTDEEDTRRAGGRVAPGAAVEHRDITRWKRHHGLGRLAVWGARTGPFLASRRASRFRSPACRQRDCYLAWLYLPTVAL